MNIPNNLYLNLNPRERTLSALAATQRRDESEINRLMSLLPDENRNDHRRFWLETNQAIDAYTIMMLGLQRDLASVAMEWYERMNELHNCPIQRVHEIDKELATLLEMRKTLQGCLCAVQTSAAEWCVKKDIHPVDIAFGYSGIPVPMEWSREECDEEMLESTRRLLKA